MRDGRAVVAVVVILVAACSGQEATAPESSPTTPPPVLTGTVALRPPDIIIGVGGLYTVGEKCDGAASAKGQDRVTRTYFGAPASSVTEGTAVSVADDKGQTIGVGALPSGRWVARPTATNLSDHLCEIGFQVPLSRSSPFYAVQVGNQPVQRFAAGAPVAITLRG